jgi:GDPmannose 4,6-dehydratase
MTATWNGYTQKPNKVVHRVAARGAFYEATEDHVVFACEDGRPVEKPAGHIRKGDQLALIGLPEPTNIVEMTEDEAWLLGIFAAEGSIKRDKNQDNYHIVVSNQDQLLLDEVALRWRRFRGGNSSRRAHPSGFANGSPVTQLRLTAAGPYAHDLYEMLYTRSGEKRVPKRILNANHETRMAFLRGFNAGDGLKSTPCVYEFQGFKTAFAVMAAGLYWLAVTTLQQRAIICTEEREGRLYFQINLNAPDAPRKKGQHLRRPLEEVVKAAPIEHKGWLFDLATTSGTFHAGVGQGWIHNSPRRGLEFVTHKVTWHAAKISLGLAKELRVGNLDAQRDWGFAGDYVRAMWLMLQQDTPDDYVVATGETHSVQKLLEVAFGCVDLDWQKYTVQDPKFMRPAEVDLLIGDPTKAKNALGWEREVSFEGLIEMMVKADIETLKAEHKL